MNSEHHETQPPTATLPEREGDAPVWRLQHNGREIVLIGTAHISQASADLVEQLIESEQPDTVCVELCETRFKTLDDPEAWKNTDIIQVIREHRTFVLFLNLVLSSVQRRMAKDMDIQPGQEMQTAIATARKQGAAIATIDREVRTTLQRVWGLMGFWTRMKLYNQLLLSVFAEEEDITQEQIEALKEKGALEVLLAEMGTQLPGVKQRLIDERDLYMIEKIRQAPGQKLLAVVGAGHVPGMLQHWHDPPIDLERLDELPPPSPWTKLFTWGIPALVVGLLVAGFFKGSTSGINLEQGLKGIGGWILLTGGMAALGSLVAFAHPLTIVAAFVAAPITTLHPLIGVGYVTGLTEAWLRKPRVKDFESLPEDILTIKGWRANQVTRILLVFILSSLGASLATFLGSGWLLKNVFGG
ncbi:MAG: TraB/GumN family protein [Candidatus Sericytochromatia bacterium]